MDKYRSHYSQEAKDKLRELKNIPLFLPPYCPELNPIEKLWAQIKH